MSAYPDRGEGVFETLLAVGGRPIELDAHLARLATSLRALFDAEPGAEAREMIVEAARGLGLGRLRLTAAPKPGGGIALGVRGGSINVSQLFPPAARAPALQSLAVPGGLGAHKWADRRLLERAEAPGAPLPLLLDDDGTVLEVSRANVFAARGGVLTTPAADGRILPGITRALAMEIARDAGIALREAHLAHETLLEADEVFLSGAVRGIEPVGSIDGVELQPGGEITQLLAGALRSRWAIPE